MEIINITNFRKNIFEYLTQTIKYNEPLSISTKDGNVVLLSENDYLSLLEILYVTSKPSMKEILLEGKILHYPNVFQKKSLFGNE